MIVFDDNSEPLILDNIHVPTAADHIWVLDLNIMDYTLSPLLVLEEHCGQAITICIQGFEFTLPSNWNLLVYDEETYQLDVVAIKDLAGKEFTAAIAGPKLNTIYPGKIIVTDYHPHFCDVAPALTKHQMLCYPIGPEIWVNTAPSDGYNKYLKEKYVGDLI